MYICMCLYVCVYICIYIYTYTYTCLHMCLCVCVYLIMCMCICICICVHMCMCICVINIYITENYIDFDPSEDNHKSTTSLNMPIMKIELSNYCKHLFTDYYNYCLALHWAKRALYLNLGPESACGRYNVVYHGFVTLWAILNIIIILIKSWALFLAAWI